MILTTLASIFLNGIAILIGTLSVMRLFYRMGICEPPSLANDESVPGGGRPVDRSDAVATDVMG
jgi:hypothetical protein